MSYTVLARRYRSATFDEVIGQDHVAQTLKKAIESDRIAHAYLFCGTRGVGKTSMARILAKALNCQSADRPVATPCNQCNSCLAISRGESMDVIEIDAASNRGIDNIRDLISNAQYRPASARFKIYIIDEVHGLSKDAFNALLKVLEEPPSHVKFILATTEPERVLPTILSRCQRYDFRNISGREIAAHLADICRKESIKADPDALLQIAKAGAGSMRDSLSLLDRMLSVGEKHLTVEMVEHLLGLPKSQLLFNLAAAIAAGDIKSVLGQADEILRSGMSADTLIAALVEHLRNLLIARTCGADSELLEIPGMSAADIAAQANGFDSIALSQDITILEELRRQIRQSQVGRPLLDATLVRLALADQCSSIADLLAQADGNGAPTPTDPQKKNAEPRAAAPRPAPVIPRETPAPAPPPPVKPIERTEAPGVEVTADTSAASPEAPGDLAEVWQAALTQLKEQNPTLISILTHARLDRIEDGSAVIRYPAPHETILKLLDRNGKKELVRDAIGRAMNRPVGIRLELAEALPDAEAIVAAPAAPLPSRVERMAAPPADAAGSSPSTPERVSPELIDMIREECPLVKSLMDTIGADIVKVEGRAAT